MREGTRCRFYEAGGADILDAGVVFGERGAAELVLELPPSALEATPFEMKGASAVPGCGGRSPRRRAGSPRPGRARDSVTFVSSSSSPSRCELAQERPQAPVLRHARHAQEETRACRRPARSPRGTRCPGARARCTDRWNGSRLRRAVTAVGEPLERLGELLELHLAVERHVQRRRRRPSPRSPVSEPERVLDPRARARGRPRSSRRSFVRAPAQRRGALGGADREALARRSASRAGGGRRGRARRAPRARGPRVSSPRSIIASTSSGSSSRRTRFETVGFDWPTRSATSPSERPNSSSSTA